MKLSSRFIYGLRFLLYLKDASGSDLVQVGEVARQEGISEKYLESIVAHLKSAGLLFVRRGARGGYRLTRAAEAISLSTIYQALEGNDPVSGRIDAPDTGYTVNSLAVNKFIGSLENGFYHWLQSFHLGNLERFKEQVSEYSYYHI